MEKLGWVRKSDFDAIREYYDISSRFADEIIEQKEKTISELQKYVPVPKKRGRPRKNPVA